MTIKFIPSKYTRTDNIFHTPSSYKEEILINSDFLYSNLEKIVENDTTEY